MARETKVPILTMNDKGHHSVIVGETDTHYICLNRSTGEKINVEKDLLKFVLPEICILCNH